MTVGEMVRALLCGAALLGILCGCSGKLPDASARLDDWMAELGELPDGELYRSGVGEGEEGFLPPDLRDAMYGEDAEGLFLLIESYAIYLSSFAEPCELAVFCAYSANDADRLAAMCLSRIDTLRTALRGTPMEAACERAEVTCKGRVVTCRVNVG